MDEQSELMHGQLQAGINCLYAARLTWVVCNSDTVLPNHAEAGETWTAVITTDTHGLLLIQIHILSCLVVALMW